MQTLKSVAFGYRKPDAQDYSLQVTSWLGRDSDPAEMVSHTLTFPSKQEAVAFAKRAGMAFTS